MLHMISSTVQLIKSLWFVGCIDLVVVLKNPEAQIVLEYQLQIDQSESKVIALKVQLTFNH